MRKSLAQVLTHLSLYVQVIGRAGIGYPRVIPKPESKFGHGLGWVGFVSGFHGYFPVGYPKRLLILGNFG